MGGGVREGGWLREREWGGGEEGGGGGGGGGGKRERGVEAQRKGKNYLFFVPRRKKFDKKQ